MKSPTCVCNKDAFLLMAGQHPIPLLEMCPPAPKDAWFTSPGVGVSGTTLCLGEASQKHNHALSLLKQEPKLLKGSEGGAIYQPHGSKDLSRALFWPLAEKAILVGTGLATHSDFMCTCVSSPVRRPPEQVNYPAWQTRPGDQVFVAMRLKFEATSRSVHGLFCLALVSEGLAMWRPGQAPGEAPKRSCLPMDET